MRSSVHVGSFQRSVIHQPQRLLSCQASKVESVVSLPSSFPGHSESFLGYCLLASGFYLSSQLRGCGRLLLLILFQPGDQHLLMIWTEPVSYATDDNRFSPRIVAVIARLCCHGCGQM